MSADPLLKLMPASAFAEPLQAAWPHLRPRLLHWHATEGRHDLPWTAQDAYGTWISEVMLQQTQVSTGLVRYPAWMARFPSITALAKAPLAEVMQAWEGLGYNSRAQALHAAAQQMQAHHGGQMPQARADRLALPGIGPSTASAIGAFAFGLPEAIFDGNVRRVWSRWIGDRTPVWASAAEETRWYWSFAQHVMPTQPSAVRAWTQAIMDLGATVCTPKSPQCARCPLQDSCRAHALGQETRWPAPVKRPEVKPWAIRWVWWRHGDTVAVVQRPAKGVWGLMWTPPEAPEEAVLADPPLAQGSQTLSHRKVSWTLHAAPATLAPPADAHWLTRAEWEAQPWPRSLRVWWEGLSSEARDHCWAHAETAA